MWLCFYHGPVFPPLSMGFPLSCPLHTHTHTHSLDRRPQLGSGRNTFSDKHRFHTLTVSPFFTHTHTHVKDTDTGVCQKNCSPLTVVLIYDPLRGRTKVSFQFDICFTHSITVSHQKKTCLYTHTHTHTHCFKRCSFVNRSDKTCWIT